MWYQLPLLFGLKCINGTTVVHLTYIKVQETNVNGLWCHSGLQNMLANLVWLKFFTTFFKYASYYDILDRIRALLLLIRWWLMEACFSLTLRPWDSSRVTKTLFIYYTFQCWRTRFHTFILCYKCHVHVTLYSRQFLVIELIRNFW